MSEVKVNKISPRSGTALTVGDGGDTVTVTGNDIRSDAYKASDGGNLVSQSGTTITLGASGDTINVASGATLVGGGIEWQSSIVTASTLTAVAGRGYWIDTSSNTCTITLPGSASAGDQLIFVDYARNWGTNKIIIDSNGLNYQGNPDTYTVEYNTSGETLNIVYSGSTNGWIPLDDDAVADPGAPPIPDPTQKAVFAFGTTGGSSRINTSNLVSSSGVVASNTTGVGTARTNAGGASYGEDKGIFAFGQDSSGKINASNLVSNTGVVATDTTGVGTARNALRAASYSTNKAIFAFGTTASADTGVSNLVSSSGVVATDTSAVGTARNNPGAAEYGNTLAIFAFGGGPLMNTKNLVSSAGVIASDATGVGTARSSPAGTNYGGDKAIFVFGYLGSDVIADLSNLVSNTGVVASDTTGVGTQRTSLSGNGYGGDKAIIAFGNSNTASTTPTNLSNLISNTGVVASDTAGVGESRYQLSSTGYSQTA
tara:strand:+ start:66 stop:1520 length:1455 start_codon:yes stop_codon:yes gene_type:complete